MTGGKNMVHKNIKITITVPTHYPENDSHADQSVPKKEKKPSPTYSFQKNTCIDNNFFIVDEPIPIGKLPSSAFSRY